MNREQLYYETVDVLLDAYLNQKLEFGDCGACAVGNICRKASIKTKIPNYYWRYLFCTDSTFTQVKNMWNCLEYTDNRQQGEKLIAQTGYTIEELAKIEYAFETSLGFNLDLKYNLLEDDPKKAQYIGLCAVLDVLKEIHEKEDNQEEQEKLTKVYEKVMV